MSVLAPNFSRVLAGALILCALLSVAPPRGEAARPTHQLSFAATAIPASDLSPRVLAREWRMRLEAGHPFLVRVANAPALPAVRQPYRDGLVWLAPAPPDAWIVQPLAADAALPSYVKWCGLLPSAAKKAVGAVANRGASGWLARRGVEIVHLAATPAGMEAEFDRLLADPWVWSVDAAMPTRTTANDRIRPLIGAEHVQGAPWNLSGDGVAVAMWDEGRVLHTDLAGHTTNLAAGDPSEHSTHVCGTLAGNGYLSDGRYRGIAPRAWVYAWKFDDPLADLPDALNRQVRWINNSWVYYIEDAQANCEYLGSYDSYTAEYDRAVAGEYGHAVGISFAGGNMGLMDDCGIAGRDGYASIPPPSTAKNIVAVGSTNDGRAISAYSSKGPTGDGRIKPDLVAVGCMRPDPGYIVSTLPTDQYGGSGWCGTSMAAPQVTGTAALLFELAGRLEVELHPALVKALLIATARELEEPGPSYASGWGELDAAAAVAMLAEQAHATGELTDRDESVEWEITVPEGWPALEITLVWDDPAAAESAKGILVNDLELRLIDPFGVEYLPWTLNPDEPTAAAETGADHRNNVEQARVEQPAAGVWTIRVGAANLMVEQRFALAGWALGDPTCDGDADRSAGPQCAGDDCNDAEPDVHPGAAEIENNDRDEDCDGQVDEAQGDDDTAPDDDTPAPDDDQDAPQNEEDDDDEAGCGC